MGGLFYLVSALWLPFRGWLRPWPSRPGRAFSALRQAALAAAIVLVTWWTGELLGLAIAQASPPSATTAAAFPRLPHSANAIRVASVGIAFAALATVLALSAIARVALRARSTRKS